MSDGKRTWKVPVLWREHKQVIDLQAFKSAKRNSDVDFMEGKAVWTGR